jgi:hypothetical protein
MYTIIVRGSEITKGERKKNITELSSIIFDELNVSH